MDKLEVVWIEEESLDLLQNGNYSEAKIFGWRPHDDCIALTLHAPAQAEIDRLRKACARQNEEFCQVLGKALGYPWFKDDPANFPDATEEHGVCVGDHVAESLADEAAARIKSLEARAQAAEAEVARLTAERIGEACAPCNSEDAQRILSGLEAVLEGRTVEVLVPQAISWFKSLPPEAQAAHFAEQKRNYVASEMALGDEGTRTTPDDCSNP